MYIYMYTYIYTVYIYIYTMMPPTKLLSTVPRKKSPPIRPLRLGRITVKIFVPLAVKKLSHEQNAMVNNHY